MNETKDPAHEAVVVELRVSAGTYKALMRALRRDPTKLSMLMLATEIERCASPVPIPEDAIAGFETCLPSID
jgi:hypothetical protein